MDINLRQLRSFLAVAQLRSFTQAAAALHISQPTLTVQIRQLEETLGLRLFDRNPRSVALTRTGRELLPALERILQDLDTLLSDARELVAQRRGIVRIAALPSFAAGVLPDAIRQFREQHPGISFALKDVIASRVLDMIRNEDVDLGLTGGDVAFPDVDTLLTARDEMNVIFPDSHPIGRLRRITARGLADYPLVMMDQGTSVRAVTDVAFAQAGIRPVPASEATYMMTAIGMVRAGVGLAILPASAREVASDPTLRSRKINDRNFSRPIALIAKAQRTLPPAARLFCDFLVANRQIFAPK